jgi:hypothetical protein
MVGHKGNLFFNYHLLIHAYYNVGEAFIGNLSVCYFLLGISLKR